MALLTYAPSDVSVSLALLHTVTGYSEGTGITLNKDTSIFSTRNGALAHTARFHYPDKTYTLQLHLAQTSPSNQILSALQNIDDTSHIGMFPVFIKDSSGKSVFLSPTAWVEKPPEVIYSTSVESHIWTLRCANTVFGDAGNDRESNAVRDASRLASILTQFGNNLGVF